jgi:hypothetical protein
MMTSVSIFSPPFDGNGTVLLLGIIFHLNKERNHSIEDPDLPDRQKPPAQNNPVKKPSEDTQPVHESDLAKHESLSFQFLPEFFFVVTPNMAKLLIEEIIKPFQCRNKEDQSSSPGKDLINDPGFSRPNMLGEHWNRQSNQSLCRGVGWGR